MTSNKLVIVGGVAGGATAAARARRLDERAEIVLIERGPDISFANCGLPYYIGETIQKRGKLLVTTPRVFNKRYQIDIRTHSEVVAIDRKNRQVSVKDLKTGESYHESYDKLILSPGAEPIRPPVEGIDSDRLFTLRNIPDTDRIKSYVDSTMPKTAVVVGGGFIGLEMVENLAHRGVRTTIVEMLDQVMAPVDFEMAAIVHHHLKEKGVRLELGNGLKGFRETDDGITVLTEKGIELECDLVILSIGVKPESQLAQEAGLEIGSRGGIVVDAAMRTADPDIFAVGDAVEIKDFTTGQPVMMPLAGPANKQGRIAADNAMGRTTVFKGTQGTAVVKVFDLTVATTGLGEKSLKRFNVPYLTNYTHSGSHASYYPGAETMSIKLMFSPSAGRVLGAQIVGGKGVDKRIDVLATAIRGAMTVYDLEELELAYAPPFSSAKDPVNIAGYAAANILKGDLKTVHWHELGDFDPNETVLLDVRTGKEMKKEGHIEGSLNIPVDELRAKLDQLDRDKIHVLICAVGLRGYLGCRILSQHGIKCLSLSGGHKTYQHAFP